MDVVNRCAYMARAMAHRFFLMLLALLAGVGAQVESAEARAVSQRASTVVVAAHAVQAAEAGVTRQIRQWGSQALARVGNEVFPAFVLGTGALLVGVDRSHE